MQNGKAIHLSSGHRLLIPDGYEEPGFMATRTSKESPIEEEIVFQIGSDTAWMMLVKHCREMTEEEAVKLSFSLCVTKPPGKYGVR